MEEERYKIEGVKKINDDITDVKRSRIDHAVASAMYAAFATASLVYGIDGANILFGGILGTLAIREMCNGIKLNGQISELKRIRDEITNENDLNNERVK